VYHARARFRLLVQHRAGLELSGTIETTILLLQSRFAATKSVMMVFVDQRRSAGTT
jgi:hypothetical protein